MRVRGFAGLLGLSACGLLALGGCGEGRSVGPCVPVQGRVTLGGKPLVGGTVSFIPLEGGPDRPRAEGGIDAQGHYSLKTAGKEGAPAGKYRAVVTTSGEDKNQDRQFDPLYSHWAQSPLLVTVAEGAAPGAYDLRMAPLAPRPRK
jgi:hypothetical protein